MGAKALETPWDVVRRTVTEAGAEAQGETGAEAEAEAVIFARPPRTTVANPFPSHCALMQP